MARRPVTVDTLIQTRRSIWVVALFLFFSSLLLGSVALLGASVSLFVLGLAVGCKEIHACYSRTKPSDREKVKALAKEYGLPFGDESIFWKNDTTEKLQKQVTADYREYQDSIGECYCNTYDLECRKHEKEREAEHNRRERQLSEDVLGYRARYDERCRPKKEEEEWFSVHEGITFIKIDWECGRRGVYDKRSGRPRCACKDQDETIDIYTLQGKIIKSFTVPPQQIAINSTLGCRCDNRDA